MNLESIYHHEDTKFSFFIALVISHVLRFVATHFSQYVGRAVRALIFMTRPTENNVD